MTSTFQVGTVYTTGEGRDYVWRFEVVKRTAKFITVRDVMSGDTRRVGVQVWRDAESALPLGSYANAPMIDAASVYTGPV